MWEVRAMYDRLETKIVEGARQLYFLGILGSPNHDIFKIRNDEDTSKKGGGISVCLSLFPAIWENQNPQKRSAAMRNIVCHDLVIKEDRSAPSFYGLHQMAYYFLKARETLKDDKYTHRVIEDLKQWIQALRKKNSQQNSDNEVTTTTKEELKKLTKDLMPKQQQQQIQEQEQQQQQQLQEQEQQQQQLQEQVQQQQQQLQEQEQQQQYQQQPQQHHHQQEHPHHHQQEQPVSNMDGKTQEKKEGNKIDIWNYFHEQMLEYVDSSAKRPAEEYSLQEIEILMESARNNCLFLANTLSSARELAGCLNNIINWLVTAATFILWLLVTGFATTRVLVLFVSPLLAASFIFGDTCKTLFQGFIFVYVVHPFHVGDFCIIDEHMLEVRTIGIWTTSFSKVDTREEVIYPNSTLFTKTITNHRTNFDWNDSIKLEAGALNIETKDLKNSIEEYFKQKQSEIFTVINSLVVSRSENATKIAVTYKSNKDMKNSSYSQCLKEKQRLKSMFLHDLQDKVALINFDWNDHIELEIGSVNIKRKKLKESVEEYFKNSEKFNASLVVVSRAENVTKIAVTYKSNKDMKDSGTCSKCLKEKQRLKSELLDAALASHKSSKDMKDSCTYSHCLEEKQMLKSELLDALQDIVYEQETMQINPVINQRD